MDKIYEELILASEKAKFRIAEEKRLKEMVINDYVWEVTHNGYKISKITKNNITLKEGITLSDIQQKFGDEYIKMSPDMDALKKEPLAHEMLEIKPSSYIAVKQLKPWVIEEL